MREAAWYYPGSERAYEALRNRIALRAGRVDACYLDGEPVTAQSGDFYGGWVAVEIEGPFKGGLGTSRYADPREDLIGILLTQRAWESPSPPPVCLDFWTSVCQAIDDCECRGRMAEDESVR